MMGISTGFQNSFMIIGFISMELLFEFFSIPVMEKN